uniref:Uncharacterized protein n=1 Tax=Mesocestoides corti TaxID=53468 RepID=A0A5K3G0D5_MESCO
MRYSQGYLHSRNLHETHPLDCDKTFCLFSCFGLAGWSRHRCSIPGAPTSPAQNRLTTLHPAKCLPSSAKSSSIANADEFRNQVLH